MCGPVMVGIAIGAAVGAATSAITGQDPLMGAVLGGVTGGFFPGGVGVGSIYPFAPGMVSAPLAGLAGVSVSLPGVLTAAGIGLAGGMAMNMLSPQQADYNQAFTGMQYTPQAYNTQHTKVTGSGGRQAAAVLAEEIKRAKTLRSRQAGAEDYGLGMDVTGTGLQIA